MSNAKSIIALSFAVAILQSGLHANAEKFNGNDLKQAEVSIGCLTIRFHGMGHAGIKGVTKLYFIRFTALNNSDAPCRFDPYRFQVIDQEGKQKEVKKVFITKVKRGVIESLLPGGSKEYSLIFEPIYLSVTKPTKLYYEGQFLGEFTK